MTSRPDPVLSRIAALVADRSGFHLPPEKLWLLERRVAGRQKIRAASSARDYLVMLDGQEGELERLIESLRIGETSFFRLGTHLRALRRVALPELWARTSALGDPPTLKVWSAGCATGEEPYTVAMVIDRWLEASTHAGGRFQILATDISSDALDIARDGHFDADAMASVPKEMLAHYFDQEPGGGFRIRPRIKQHVRFERHNLVQDRYPTDLDLILCRNVLIYFDRATQRTVVQQMMASLSMHGYLFLGTGEVALAPQRSFTVLRTPDGVIYQRTSEKRTSEMVDGFKERFAPRPAPRPETTAAPAEEPVRDAPHVLRLDGSYDGDRLAAELRVVLTKDAGRGVILVLDGASYLAPDCAPVLGRLARTVGGGHLRIVASRPGVLRWIERHRELQQIPRCASEE